MPPPCRVTVGRTRQRGPHAADRPGRRARRERLFLGRRARAPPAAAATSPALLCKHGLLVKCTCRGCTRARRASVATQRHAAASSQDAWPPVRQPCGHAAAQRQLGSGAKGRADGRAAAHLPALRHAEHGAANGGARIVDRHVLEQRLVAALLDLVARNDKHLRRLAVSSRPRCRAWAVRLRAPQCSPGEQGVARAAAPNVWAMTGSTPHPLRLGPRDTRRRPKHASCKATPGCLVIHTKVHVATPPRMPARAASRPAAAPRRRRATATRRPRRSQLRESARGRAGAALARLGATRLLGVVHRTL